MQSQASSGAAAAGDYAAHVASLVSSDPWIMELLRAVRSIGLVDWCIAAGVIRNKVWDHLHGYAQRTPTADIDVLFYDPLKTEPEFEQEIQRRLSRIVPGVSWDAVNQATIHHYNKEPAYSSIAHAMSRWADPVTAVGVRLTGADEITVIAPHGLHDLFNLTVRPNLLTPNAAEVYRQRMRSKRWNDRWPRLTITCLEEST